VIKMSETIELKKSELIAKLAPKLSPTEQEKLKTQPKKQWHYTPGQMKGFKLSFNVKEITITTDVKYKALEAPKDNSVIEKNKVTGNKVVNRVIDKGTGQRLERGYGFAKYDEITNQPVPDSDIQLVQIKPDASSPTGVTEIEVSKFEQTKMVDITDAEILPRHMLDDWIVDREYQLFGIGKDLFDVAKSLVERKAVAGIKEFTLVESNIAYRAFLVPPPVLTEDKFYLLLKLVRRKRESLITAWLNRNDVSESTEKKTKIKTGQKIDNNLDEF
jgi:hypothetical protein